MTPAFMRGFLAIKKARLQRLTRSKCGQMNHLYYHFRYSGILVSSIVNFDLAKNSSTLQRNSSIIDLASSFSSHPCSGQIENGQSSYSRVQLVAAWSQSKVYYHRSICSQNDIRHNQCRCSQNRFAISVVGYDPLKSPFRTQPHNIS